MTYASSGVGSTTHLGPELLATRTGLQFTHVPYRGGGVFVTDHLAGRVDVTVNTSQVMAPHIRSGALRALAVTGARRAPDLPEVPTFAEAGVEGVILEPWTGFVVPATTPAPVVERLNAAFNAALREPVTRRKLEEGGYVITGGTPQQFGDYMRDEIARWGEIIRANNIRPE